MSHFDRPLHYLCPFRGRWRWLVITWTQVSARLGQSGRTQGSGFGDDGTHDWDAHQVGPELRQQVVEAGPAVPSDSHTAAPPALIASRASGFQSKALQFWGKVPTNAPH